MSKEKFVCDKCGCDFLVKDRNNFECPNCEDKSICLECGKLEFIDRDIQLCMGCIDKFDLDELWRLHDLNEIDALDFNENKSMRDRFRLK